MAPIATPFQPSHTSRSLSSASTAPTTRTRGQLPRAHKPTRMVHSAATRPGEAQRVARVFMRKKQGENRRSSDEPVLFTIDSLRPLFTLPIKEAAARMNLCPTALKSVCRKLGINRWPFKQHRNSTKSPVERTPSERTRSIETVFEDEEACTPPPPHRAESSETVYTDASPAIECLESSRSSSPADFQAILFFPESSNVQEDEVMLDIAEALEPAPVTPTTGCEPDLDRIARLHERIFPEIYSSLREDLEQPAGGDELAFVLAGIEAW